MEVGRNTAAVVGIDSHYSDLTIIVPTLNEERNISNLLSRLSHRYPGASIIVSDDGSADRTQELVRTESEKNPRIQLLDRSRQTVKGLTVSVLDGIKRAKTRFFAVMDGDLQHPEHVLGDFHEQLRAGSKLVSGARKEIDILQPRHRVLATQIMTAFALISLRSRGIRVTDPLSGLFAGEVKTVLKLIESHPHAFEFGGYKVLFDILRLLPSGFEVSEVPYSFLARSEGSSKASLRHALYFMRSLLSRKQR